MQAELIVVVSSNTGSTMRAADCFYFLLTATNEGAENEMSALSLALTSSCLGSLAWERVDIVT